MLNLVPLAGAWWQVAYADRELELVGKLLQLDLPQSKPVTVAATAVSRYQQTRCIRIEGLSQLSVPGTYCLDRKLSRVMADTYTHPGFILRQVIHPVGCPSLCRGSRAPGLLQALPVDAVPVPRSCTPPPTPSSLYPQR